jgi:putative PIN family toxin of toxin-antitoxin system
MSAGRQAVFDCNVFLQAMLNIRGAAHACWQKAVTGEVKLYVSAYILAEIRSLVDHRDLRRFRQLSVEKIERFIEEIIDVSTLVDPSPPAEFQYQRDPDDAHYVNLAIATQSLLVVSNDRDLLNLMDDRNSEGKSLRAKYPRFQVLTPAKFLSVK